MKLSGMREVLAARGIGLTKSLGQNFLHDRNQLRRIVEAADVSKEDSVLEIGPGLGPLTELLLEKAGRVLAIEMDARLAEFLRGRFFQPRFELVHDDALDFLRRDRRDWSAWKVAANLPYSAASPILVELARSAAAPKKMAVTVQLEVAQRIAARPGGRDYGVLTLLLGLDFEVKSSFRIPKSCFFPAPDVESACLALDRRARPLIPPDLRPVFGRIVKRAFSQRRKMLFKLLKSDWPESSLNEAFAALKASPRERAEKLSLQQFARLTEILAEKTAP
ncbi:MAG: ribosomal RNA small subunit methyltransferase A [Verrucomicrobia bacterium]|nr:ribosomal RNA small subunit methyltransferase A [Verrucomicrobiota bacterium]MDE3100054.1 ribosomal RNA small subunit methyltransferase A [Verrucomicrobiota bacterium]